MEGAIGIFDSGLGGLTVLKEARKLLPNQNFIYFGDTLRVPYGNRSREEIIKFALEIVDFLMARQVGLLVIACNTIDSAAREVIEDQVDIPVLGVIKAGAELAIETSRQGRLGLIATRATVESGAYARRLGELADCQLYSQAIPEFVEIVESGDKSKLGELMEEKLGPINRSGIDSLILGCTHFPALEQEIRGFLREDIELVNPALGVAQQLRELVGQDASGQARVDYYVSSDPEGFRKIGEKILGQKIESIEEVSLG